LESLAASESQDNSQHQRAKECRGALFQLAHNNEKPPPPVDDQATEGRGGVMISYSWAQQIQVVTLARKLRERGVSVWLDIWNMKGSTLECMALAVESATVVICTLSQEYKDSPSCRTEAEYAYALRRPIVPVKFDTDYQASGWLGALLGTRLYYDFGDKASSGPTETFDALLRELTSMVKFVPAPAVATAAEPAVATPAVDDMAQWTTQQVIEWLQEAQCVSDGVLEELQRQQVDGAALSELAYARSSSEHAMVAEFLNQLHFETVGEKLRFLRCLRRRGAGGT